MPREELCARKSSFFFEFTPECGLHTSEISFILWRPGFSVWSSDFKKQPFIVVFPAKGKCRAYCTYNLAGARIVLAVPGLGNVLSESWAQLPLGGVWPVL